MDNRPVKKPRPGRAAFKDLMRPRERAAACVYLLLHVGVLPIALPFLLPGLAALDLNAAYYAIGVAFAVFLCRDFLRAGFDAALDNRRAFVLALLSAYVLEMGLTLIVSSLFQLLGLDASSPNNGAVMSMAPEGFYRLLAMTAVMAPVVEETLFRGLLFGALYRYSRVLAWITSAAAFSLYHVWQYAVYDPALLVTALLYLPASLALNWCYLTSGSIWAPILYHSLTNVFAVCVLA